MPFLLLLTSGCIFSWWLLGAILYSCRFWLSAAEGGRRARVGEGHLLGWMYIYRLVVFVVLCIVTFRMCWHAWFGATRKEQKRKVQKNFSGTSFPKQKKTIRTGGHPVRLHSAIALCSRVHVVIQYYDTPSVPIYWAPNDCRKILNTNN